MDRHTGIMDRHNDSTVFHYAAPIVYYQAAHSIMWLLHPFPRATGNYAALRTHYVPLWLHYAALGLPRPAVYGIPLAA